MTSQMYQLVTTSNLLQEFVIFYFNLVLNCFGIFIFVTNLLP